MAWGTPLIAEWQLVTKATGNPEGTLFHTFSVSNDGTITETNNRLVFVSGPHALTPTEFKILDALVNQINREPIPADHLTFPPDRDDQDRWLSLDNDPDIFGLSPARYSAIPLPARLTQRMISWTSWR